MADPPLSKDPKDNPFSFYNFVSKPSPAAKLIIAPDEQPTQAKKSTAPSATAAKLDQLLNTNDLFQDVKAKPSASKSRPPPVDLFEIPPPPPPTSAPIPTASASAAPIVVPRSISPMKPPLVEREAPPPPPPASADDTKKTKEDDNPFAFSNFLKQRGIRDPTIGMAAGDRAYIQQQLEELQKKAALAEQRAVAAETALKKLKEKDAIETKALEQAVQTVERQLQAATERAVRAEQRLADSQAELARVRAGTAPTDVQHRTELLENQLKLVHAKGKLFANQLREMAEGAERESQLLQKGATSLKELAVFAESIEKIGPTT